MDNLILMCVGAALAAVMALLRARSVKKFNALDRAGMEPKDAKKAKRPIKLFTLGLAAGGWIVAVQAVTLIFGPKEAEKFTVEIFAPRMMFLGMEISSTVVVTWIAMAVVLVLAVLVRLLVIPKMKDVPTGIQNVLELAVETANSYTVNTGGELGENLPAYIFSVAVLMIASAAVEMFGVRAPTADITMTFSMALITFILINYYGIKQKGGVGGRIKTLASPTPVVFPMRIVSDIAVPVSLACRMFGNMLGGMIVMDLLYSSLGNAGILFPSLVGLYFNVFHPLIQVYIFVTLSLTFIREATE